jgi:MFS family permease
MSSADNKSGDDKNHRLNITADFRASKNTSRINPQQWKSGLAAWLGWTFDGLELHIYTLIATPFVAELLHTTNLADPRIGHYGSIIQAGFLIGWALGGAFFGRIGDLIGRSHALCLTVLTYAICTGLAYFSTEWWHLLCFRFLAALGIGGEWAVGACLLSETWPKKWRPWIAAVLQTGVNIGILLAAGANAILSHYPPRFLFLVGVIPAFLVLWIRSSVPEPVEWKAARSDSTKPRPGAKQLFSGRLLKTTLITSSVCAISLTAHWAFMFWYIQHIRNLAEVVAMTPENRNLIVSKALYLVIISSIVGNFFASAISRVIGYRKTIGWMCAGYALAMSLTYFTQRGVHELLFWFPVIGFFQGLFGLFTMYLPPLFPTLNRTTGAGFCYNIGRIAAAFGTMFFGLFSKVGDHRLVLFYAGFLFVPAAVLSFFMPDSPDSDEA